MSGFLFLALLVEPLKATLADPISVTITAPQNLPQLRGQLIQDGNFAILREKQDGHSITFILDPLRTGSLPLTIDNETATVTITPYTIRPSLLKPEGPLPLIPPLPIPLNEKSSILLDELKESQWQNTLNEYHLKTISWRAVLLTLLLALGLPALIYFLGRQKLITPSKPSPKLRALAELEAIKRNPHLTPVERYKEVIQTLRYYLQDQFSLPSPHLTTEELLNQKNLPEKLKNNIQIWLHKADAIKFNEQTITLEETNQVLNAIVGWMT